MHTISDLRPETAPISLRDVTDLFDTWELHWIDTSGETESASFSGVGEVPSPIGDTRIEGVSVTTLDLGDGWAFVGVGGAVRHGAELAGDAKQKGAALLVTDEAGYALAADSGLPALVVKDPRAAAGIIASALHSGDLPNLTLVGVTGTNGKTTSTYLMRAALQPICSPVGVMGTLEIDAGDRKILAERTTHESPVVYRTLAQAAQAGMSGMVVEVSAHAMSLNRVENLKFDLAVFTNLQHDHLDFYEGSMDLYLEAKAKLFTPDHTKVGVVGVDDEYGRALARTTTVPIEAVQYFSEDDPAIGSVPLWRVSDATPDADAWGTRFTLTTPKGDSFPAFCPVPGLVNVQNAALCIIGAHLLGAPLEEAIASLAAAPSIPGRMNLVPRLADHQPRVVVDYAHTPEAIERLVKDFRAMTPGEVIAVFGTDGDRDASKRAPLARIVADLADVLWVTDENPRTEDAASIRKELLDAIAEVRPNMENVTEVQTSRRDAIRKAIMAAGGEDTILLFGKGAETYQEVEGVKHHFVDAEVVKEVFEATK